MIGIFGGTFNPVHWGHIRTALDIKNVLQLSEMLLIPCGIPPHRELPDVSSDVRLAMLKAAIEGTAGLKIDERELKRAGPSYTVDTLQSFSDELPDESMALCVGADAFLKLHSWHQWERLFDFAHIVVAYRPGWPIDAIKQQVPNEFWNAIEKRWVQNPIDLKQKSAGFIFQHSVTKIEISSSNVRYRVANQKLISELVPKGVAEIILQKKLYRESTGS
jgi:nicotinate-nucleotide adenylyltransferase